MVSMDSGNPVDFAELLQHPQTQLLLAAIAAVLFLIFLLKVIFSAPKGNVVLLTGPCDAGKTTMFLQLRDGTAHSGTVASMQPNDDTFTLVTDKAAGKPVRVVDVPGHPRVRGSFEPLLDKSRAIVFVVDSVEFLPNKAATAEQLFEIISHPLVSRRRLPLLIACNKQDLGVKAHTVEFIRKRLEKEIDQLRGTRSTLKEVSGAKDSNLLSTGGEPFTFDDWAKSKRGSKVSFAGVSAKTGELADVAAFIRTLVPA